ncbi:hypothetical protein Glove_350g117 [Diversispora epigaea]|uniref:Uncharacterized protein n=1 Tax=Diversispora epigaea TaxID=1348612 RepID=A0A397HCX6_9GLOM|nr:hypothetical protein Glove_350g117 [Diversispora epigaea]
MEAFKFIFLLFLIVSLFNVNDAATSTTISRHSPRPIYKIGVPPVQKRSDKKLKRRFACINKNCPMYSLRKRAYCNCPPRPIYTSA